MGKRKNNQRGNRRGDDQNKDNNENQQQRNNTWGKVDPETIDHAVFKKYYLDNIVSTEDWEKMVPVMRTILPASFRFSNIRGKNQQITNELSGECFGLPTEPITATGQDDKTVELRRPQPLPWYQPQGDAWQIDMGRAQLKRFPALKKFHEFIVCQDHRGNVTRQEAVSMIPPLLLGVEPHHLVLDMCAAPGSKTSQLLDFLHRDVPEGQVPTGLVVANDANGMRAQLLTHQLQRLGSPNFLVTNYEGQFFPQFYRKPFFAQDLNLETGASAQATPLRFDRILCDAPCGGDGTMRKTPTVWSNWSLYNSYALQPLQLQIAYRGLQMLNEGGYMVYSTCSINPLEDEAVVMELLRRGGGNVELVDIKGKLPGLVYQPGRATWKNWVETGHGPTQDVVEVTCLADILALPQKVIGRLKPTSFTPELQTKLRAEAKVYADEQLAAWKVHCEEFKKSKTEEERAAILAEPRPEPRAAYQKNGQKVKAPKAKHIPHVVHKFVQELLRHKELPPVDAAAQIHKTARVLPHQQNSGGFYIALLKKTGPIPEVESLLSPIPYAYSLQKTDQDAMLYNAEKHDEVAINNSMTQYYKIEAKRQRDAQRAEIAAAAAAAAASKKDDEQEEEEDVVEEEEEEEAEKNELVKDSKFVPVKFTPKNNDKFALAEPKMLEAIQQVYAPKIKFPLLTRGINRLFLLNELAYDIVLTNPKMTIIHSGLKAFENDNKMADTYNTDTASVAKLPEAVDSKFYSRVCSDAVHFIASQCTKQLMEVQRQDVVHLVNNANQNTQASNFADETLKKYWTPEETKTPEETLFSGCVLVKYYCPINKRNFYWSGYKRGRSIHLQLEAQRCLADKWMLGVDAAEEAKYGIVAAVPHVRTDDTVDGDELVQLEEAPVEPLPAEEEQADNKME